jgi:hypothetical protein
VKQRYPSPPPGVKAVADAKFRTFYAIGENPDPGPIPRDAEWITVRLVCSHDKRQPESTITHAMQLVSGGPVLWDSRDVHWHGRRAKIMLRCVVCRYNRHLGRDRADALWALATRNRAGAHLFDIGGMSG